MEIFWKWRVFGVVVVVAARSILSTTTTYYFRYPYNKRFRGPGIPIISTDFRVYYFRDEIISGPVVFYVARGCETPRGPGLGSGSKRKNKKKKIQKYKPEKRRNKRSIIKYAYIVGKGVAGEGGRERQGDGFSAAAGREKRKEFPSTTTSGPDFIQRQKRWNLCASRLPCRRHRREEYDMHFFFHFFLSNGAHTNHTKEHGNARACIYFYTLYAYARWILRIIVYTPPPPFSISSDGVRRFASQTISSHAISSHQKIRRIIIT